MHNPPFKILRPKPNTTAEKLIATQAGIVGIPEADATAPSFLVYYEGNLYNAQNLKSYEQRIKCAADRLWRNYPSIAKGLFPQEEFDVIGQVSYAFNEPGNHWWVQLDQNANP